MTKRGYVSIFIIIGILAITISALLITPLGDMDMKEDYSSASSRQAKMYIDTCLDISASDALVRLGRQGGTLGLQGIPEEDKIKMPFGEVPIYPPSGDMDMPDSDSAEEELGLAIDDALYRCAAGISDLPGMDADIEKPKTKVNIAERSISVDVVMPVRVREESREERITRFSRTFDISLTGLYSASRDIAYSDRKYDMNYLSELDADAEIFTFDDNTQMIVLTDNNAAINQKPYKFVFAVVKQ